MDVLQIIKSDHDKLRDVFARLKSVSSAPEKREWAQKLSITLRRHLEIEQDYLYPEISGLFQGSQLVVSGALSSHSKIMDLVEELASHLKKKSKKSLESAFHSLEAIETLLGSHLERVESQIMPKIRQYISTDDREELGFVFLDVRAEALA